MNVQTLYQEAIIFAGLKHSENNQLIPGSKLPYIVHVSNVAMEVIIAAQHSPDLDLALAVQAALLHDTLEDTSATYEELEQQFGKQIADGVLALTKDEALPIFAQLPDSLNRIRKQPKAIWAVKLADRITNLQAPPTYWTNEKRKEYRQEAIMMLEELEGGNAYLENRLKEKIIVYKGYYES